GPLALAAGAGEEPPALTLFAARLAAQRGGRPLEPGERALALAIARRVDGLPLALELMAARAALLGADVVLEELERGGACMLDGLLAAQLEGLEPSLESALVALCATGGDLDAREAAIAMGSSFEDATERLRALRERSLIHAEEGRFLVRSPIVDFVKRRWPEERKGALARVAAQWAAPIAQSPDDETLAAVLHARANALRALADAPDHALVDVARIWSALARASWASGPWLAGALGQLAGRLQGAEPAVRCDVEHALAEVRLHVGELDAAQAAHERTLALARELGDEARLARALRQRAVILVQQGDLDAAEQSVASAMEIARRVTLPRLEGACALMAARLALRRGEHARAQELYSQSLSFHRLARDRRFEGLALAELGMLCLDRGDWAEAAEHAESIARLEHADAALGALARGLQAAIEHERGELSRALAGYEVAAARAEANGMAHYASMCRAYRATALLEHGELAPARSALSTEAARLRAMGDGAHAQLFEAFAQLAEARLDGRPLPSPAGAPSAEAWLDAAMRALGASGPAEPAPHVDAHFDSRVAARVRRKLERASNAPRPAELRIEPGAFVTPHGRVDTRRRTAMRNILIALANQPGVALDADALIAAGWPGERMRAEAARNRLHVTLHRLRELGVREMVVAVGGGWALEASVRVVRVEPHREAQE
ncbi:MAG: tetratricopeptide repeat protein, partial [Sandaracinaceae bacterium]|nr:tetratricopeptide repeat protein [Sandaracinaceae bacterium]